MATAAAGAGTPSMFEEVYRAPHKNKIKLLSFHPVRNWLACCDEENALFLYEFALLKRELRYTFPRDPKSGHVRQLCFDSGHKLFVLYDTKLVVHDISRDAVSEANVLDAKGSLTCVALFSHSPMAVVGSSDGSLRLIDLLTLQVKDRRQHPSTRSVTHLVTDAKDDIVAALSDATLVRFSPSLTQVVEVPKAHSEIIDIAIDNEQGFLYTCGADKQIVIRSVAQLTPIQKIGMKKASFVCMSLFRGTAFLSNKSNAVIVLHPQQTEPESIDLFDKNTKIYAIQSHPRAFVAFATNVGIFVHQIPVRYPAICRRGNQVLYHVQHILMSKKCDEKFRLQAGSESLVPIPSGIPDSLFVSYSGRYLSLGNEIFGNPPRWSRISTLKDIRSANHLAWNSSGSVDQFAAISQKRVVLYDIAQENQVSEKMRVEEIRDPVALYGGPVLAVFSVARELFFVSFSTGRVVMTLQNASERPPKKIVWSRERFAVLFDGYTFVSGVASSSFVLEENCDDAMFFGDAVLFYITETDVRVRFLRPAGSSSSSLPYGGGPGSPTPASPTSPPSSMQSFSAHSTVTVSEETTDDFSIVSLAKTNVVLSPYIKNPGDVMKEAHRPHGHLSIVGLFNDELVVSDHCYNFQSFSIQDLVLRIRMLECCGAAEDDIDAWRQFL